MSRFHVKQTTLKGCLLIQPKVFEDDRGYFFESFSKREFQEITGQPIEFVQDNESLSQKGVLRGLHFQTGEHAQGKLVRAIYGAIQDVAVDCRPNSSTFGQSYSIVLSADQKNQLWIPRGFAHGFYVLSEMAIVQYKCDNYYRQSAESGIRYDDTFLDIDWQLKGMPLLSEKDASLGSFKEIFG